MIALPTDANAKVFQLTPNVEALVATYDASISSATDITLNAATSYIEITAIDKGIFMKYGATASSSDFDEFIAQNTTRAYIVPSGVSVISIIQEAATAKAVIIEK